MAQGSPNLNLTRLPQRVGRGEAAENPAAAPAIPMAVLTRNGVQPVTQAPSLIDTLPRRTPWIIPFKLRQALGLSFSSRDIKRNPDKFSPNYLAAQMELGNTKLVVRAFERMLKTVNHRIKTKGDDAFNDPKVQLFLAMLTQFHYDYRPIITDDTSEYGWNFPAGVTSKQLKKLAALSAQTAEIASTCIQTRHGLSQEQVDSLDYHNIFFANGDFWFQAQDTKGRKTVLTLPQALLLSAQLNQLMPTEQSPSLPTIEMVQATIEQAIEQAQQQYPVNANMVIPAPLASGTGNDLSLYSTWTHGYSESLVIQLVSAPRQQAPSAYVLDFEGNQIDLADIALINLPPPNFNNQRMFTRAEMRMLLQNSGIDQRSVSTATLHAIAAVFNIVLISQVTREALNTRAGILNVLPRPAGIPSVYFTFVDQYSNQINYGLGDITRFVAPNLEPERLSRVALRRRLHQHGIVVDSNQLSSATLFALAERLNIVLIENTEQEKQEVANMYRRHQERHAARQAPVYPNQDDQGARRRESSHSSNSSHGRPVFPEAGRVEPQRQFNTGRFGYGNNE